MLQDLRFALKLLSKEKAVTLAALATLALCIGANTAIFSVLRAVILGPLHYPEPKVVKTSADDPAIAGAIRAELRRVDPEVALFDVKTMGERLAASMGNRQAAMAICLVFAGLALVLSALGIYGVLAYTVTQRTREFGIRMAMGAARTDVVGLVVGQGLKHTAAGLAIGGAGALALTRLMTAMLFHVRPDDPAVYGAALAAVTGWRRWCRR